MSSLVACPICNKNVPDWYMNDHLDRECKGVAEAVPGAGALDGEPVTPSRKRAKPASSFLVSPTKSPAAAKRPRSGSQHAARPPTLVQSHSLQMPNHADPFVDNAVLGKPKAADPPVSDEEKRRGNKRLPLAERLRPLSLDTFVGQQDLVGPTGMLRRIIENDQVTSMIFWGSPGLGKTTLARIIARRTKAMFKEMSGVTQNISDVRKVIEEAGNAIRLSGKRTILFLDEIHRFNKAQQDVFLPHLERGQITLIGATTENPSFKLNSALLSRCRVFRLENLTEDDIQCIAQRAAKLKQEDFGVPQKGLDDEIVKYVASVSNGDARVAINTIDLAMSALPSDGPSRTVSLDDIKNALQRTHTVYGAEEHYDLISALHKSVRGSDANAALYWLGRILAGGDDPL
ncbi:DNA-dependent ATPase mgs1, partial [Linderina macrospora]